jgi:uncharacterized caspase-like protein
MLRVAVIILSLVLLPSHARAERRVALLIGNKDYKPGVGALTNPLNDTRIVGDALKAIGFEVLKSVQNARRADMLIAIHEFAEKLRNAGSDAVGFLYYSGHGIASGGENYLIPVDIDEPSTVQLSVQGVKQSEVLAILRTEAPNAAHYLILDACRNTLQGARGGKGFIPVGQQSGVLVGFATEPGKTASDTGQGSGPYAAALAAELVKPDQSDLIMFHHVRVAVMEKTGGDQVPWTEDGIQRRDRVEFGGTGKAALQPQSSEAAQAWAAAKNTTSVAVLEDFIRRYKDTFYAGLAQARLEDLKKQQASETERQRVALLQKKEEEKRKQAEAETRAKADAEARAGGGGTALHRVYVNTTDLAKSVIETGDPVDDIEGREVRVVRTQRGDTVSSVLLKMGAETWRARAMADAARSAFPDGALAPGLEMHVTLVPSVLWTDRMEPIRFSIYGEDHDHKVTVTRNAAGEFVAKDSPLVPTPPCIEIKVRQNEQPCFRPGAGKSDLCCARHR